MDDPIRLIEIADLAAMRDLCKELLAEVRALRAEVSLLHAQVVAMPQPTLWSWPGQTPGITYIKTDPSVSSPTRMIDASAHVEGRVDMSDYRMWGQN